MRVHQHQPRSADARRWAARLLFAAGIALIAWSAVFVLDGHLAQWAARRSLESVTLPEPPVYIPVPPGRAPAAPPVVRKGAPIADLSIPRLGLSAIVLHGSDEQTLRRAPGHIERTALPGQRGNVVIAGHRDTFFRPLRNIRVGDDIFLATGHQRIHYRVTWLRVVNPRDLSVIAPTEDEAVTLVTCYPFWVLGHAPDRFIVRATRIDDPRAIAAATAAPQARPRTDRTSTRTTRAARGVVDATPAAHAAPAIDAAPAADDETQVRHAVERFRLAYNGRLDRSGEPLRFRSCEVAVTGDQAAAACTASPSSADDRTFILQRSDGGWAIRSIQVE